MHVVDFAALVFQTACTSCGTEPSANSSKCETDFGTRTKLCKACSKTETIVQHSKAFKERYPELDPRVMLLAVPRNSTQPYRRSDYVTAQIDEIVSSLDDHDADDSPDKISRMAFFNQAYQSAQNRLAEAKAVRLASPRVRLTRQLNDAVTSWRLTSRYAQRRGTSSGILSTLTRAEKYSDQQARRVERRSEREEAETTIVARLEAEEYSNTDIVYLRNLSFTYKSVRIPPQRADCAGTAQRQP